MAVHPQRCWHSPGPHPQWSARRWVPRPGRSVRSAVGHHRTRAAHDGIPHPAVPYPSRCEDGPEPRHTAAAWATSGAHPRVSHSGDGHSGRGGRSTRSGRSDSGSGGARRLDVPQWAWRRRVPTAATCAAPSRRQVQAWSNGLTFNGRTLGRRERGASALTRRKIRPYPMETCPSTDGASR